MQRGGRDSVFYFSRIRETRFGTEMARHLVKVVKETQPQTTICAFTLPETNGSNRILQKRGFCFAGETRDEDELVVWRWELRPT